MENLRNTTLVYVSRGEEYLLLHRIKKENDINRDKWIGLGGKLENGESPEDCLLREVREETGLRLNSWRYHGFVTFVQETEGLFTEYMHLFSSDDFSGTLQDCDEGVPEWVPKNQLSRLELWEGDLIFLRLMEEGAPFFSLKLYYRGDALHGAVLNGRALRREGYGQWT